MPPKRRVPRTLKRVIEESVETHRNKENRLAFIIPEIEDHLLRELHLQPDTLKKARMIAAHHLRIARAEDARNWEGFCATTARTARNIVAQALKDLPEFLERSKGNPNALSEDFVEDCQKVFENSKPILEHMPDEGKVELPIELVSFAGTINSNKLRALLGNETYRTYVSTLQKALQAMGTALKKT